MVRYAGCFLLGAFLALIFQPWLFPDGFVEALRHMWGQ